MNCYDEDYFERGIQTGKSCYENYRWIPELTIPMAMTLIDVLGIRPHEKVLDFGCAKGFLVKALRLLHRDAWGLDCSEYAIQKADPEVDGFCRLCMDGEKFDLIIAKDVLEHIEYEKIYFVLKDLRARGDKMFAIIPLGENGQYRVPAYEKDVTHCIRENENWWIREFMRAGWRLDWFAFKINGIKDNWKMFEKGNGFFKLW